MQVTETVNEGLKREIKVMVPAADMESRLMARLDDAKAKVRINGFRPGKVPIAHLRKIYGKSFMAEVVNEILTDSTRSVLADRGEKAAMQPEVSMTEDEKEAEEILAGRQDFQFSISYEIIPPIDLQDPSGIKVTRPVLELADTEIEEQVLKVAESARSYEPKKGKAADGDRVTIDFVGRIDGETFEGGSDTGTNLVLGSNQFIPGFEGQLVGAKAGDERKVTVTFPQNYPAAHLAGKEAEFEVTVGEVAAPGDLEITDEVAKQLGLESAERLRQVVREQLENQYGMVTRQKVKRQILDALDAAYKFEAPSKLVDAEFENIWRQVNADLENAGRTFADEETTEEEAREEYKGLAERRVRLGLVLSAIGEKEEVEITEDEMQRALYEHVRQYPGREQEVYNFYRENPDAVANLRAPLFEEKVVDHLMTQIAITDKTVSKEELLADDEDVQEAAPKKAAAAKKKAAPKKKTAPKKAPAKAKEEKTAGD